MRLINNSFFFILVVITFVLINTGCNNINEPQKQGGNVQVIEIKKIEGNVTFDGKIILNNDILSTDGLIEAEGSLLQALFDNGDIFYLKDGKLKLEFGSKSNSTTSGSIDLFNKEKNDSIDYSQRILILEEGSLLVETKKPEYITKIMLNLSTKDTEITTNKNKNCFLLEKNQLGTTISLFEGELELDIIKNGKKAKHKIVPKTKILLQKFKITATSEIKKPEEKTQKESFGTTEYCE